MLIKIIFKNSEINRIMICVIYDFTTKVQTKIDVLNDILSRFKKTYPVNESSMY